MKSRLEKARSSDRSGRFNAGVRSAALKTASTAMSRSAVPTCTSTALRRRESNENRSETHQMRGVESAQRQQFPSVITPDVKGTEPSLDVARTSADCPGE